MIVTIVAQAVRTGLVLVSDRIQAMSHKTIRLNGLISDKPFWQFWKEECDELFYKRVWPREFRKQMHADVKPNLRMYIRWSRQVVETYGKLSTGLAITGKTWEVQIAFCYVKGGVWEPDWF